MPQFDRNSMGNIHPLFKLMADLQQNASEANITKMLGDLILQILVRPIMLLISTPFVLFFAMLKASSRKQKFAYAVQDGYLSVSEFCRRCTF